MIRQKTRSTSHPAILEEEMFCGVDESMKKHGGCDARGSLEYLSVCESRDRRKNHIAPVGEGLRAIIQMGATEDDGRNDQNGGGRAELLHEPVLDECAEQDLFRKRGGQKDNAESLGGCPSGQVGS